MNRRLPLLAVALCGCIDLSTEGKRFAGEELPDGGSPLTVFDASTPDASTPDGSSPLPTPEDAGEQPWSDPTLTGLTITPGSLSFSPATTMYRVVVPRGTAQVELVASAARPERSSLVVDGRGVAFGAPFTVALAGLSTTLTLRVTAESGATQSYTLLVVQPGPFTVQATLKAAPPMSNAAFGYTFSSSRDGNLLAVGAPGENGRGAVYVFARTGATWAMQARVVGSNTDSADVFGCAVALSADGTTLAAGAIGEDSDATGINGAQNNALAASSGAVYVFTRVGASWAQQAYVKASNTAAGDRFGFDVRLSATGDVLVAAAPKQDSSGVDSGAVYVFARSAGAWAQELYLKAPTPGAGDEFGTALALDAAGTTLAVSSPNLVGGKVFVFARGATWARQLTAMSPSNLEGDGFGAAIALSESGDLLAIGAPGQDSNTGTAYVLQRSGTTWSSRASARPAGAVAGDLFGSSVALDATGATLAVGALGEGDGAGALYVYEGQGATLGTPARLTAPSPSLGAHLGAWWLALSNDGSSLFGGMPGDTNEAGSLTVWARVVP